MTTTLDREQVTDEAIRVLIAHMAPEKVALFLSTWKGGHGNYAKERQELFGNLTVDQLLEELKVWRADRKKP